MITDKAVRAFKDVFHGGRPMSYDEIIRAGLTAALPHLSAPCAVEVAKLHWDGLVGFVGSFSYVVAPPSLTKGWRVWGKLSDKSASVGGVLITTTAADEEEAKAAAQADFERRILSCVVTKPVDVAAVREALTESRIDLVILRGNIADAAKTDSRWEGMPDRVQSWIDRIDAALALSAEPAKGKRWQPIKTAAELDRVIVAGWQEPTRTCAGYWWYHDDVIIGGKASEHPSAILWHPFPDTPQTAPTSEAGI